MEAQYPYVHCVVADSACPKVQNFLTSLLEGSNEANCTLIDLRRLVAVARYEGPVVAAALPH